MKYLLNIISKTLKLIRKPYDDEKTMNDILVATQKTVEYYKKLKDTK